MKKDIIRIYFVEFFLLIILILALFVSNMFNKKILALLLIIITFIVFKTIKKSKSDTVYARQVKWLMIGFGFIYLLIYYLLGLYFGYYKAPTTFGIKTIIDFIIPFTVIIVSSEILRKRLISQKGKLSKTLVFIIMVLIDLVIYTGVYDITKLDDMLAIIGFILFASIACNLLYNYITLKFGINGIIAFRLITVLYAYFIPYIPNIYIFFASFLRMIYPYIMYLVLEYSYSKGNMASKYSDRHKNIIYTTVIFIVTTLIIALVSCKFIYGVIVIGSGSMTGTLDIGDVIVFKQYDGNSSIKKDMIIIFKNEDIKTVHRVIDVVNYNGEFRYYTKGDNNQEKDDGYRIKSDIIGITKFKIPYLGYPSLVLRDIFD